MVQLKRKILMICRDCLIQFQFHNGTIKTNGGTTEISPNSIFQFHNGTIKTIQCSNIGHILGNFNSIMVQLKHVIPDFGITFHPLFQFHNGTIKTTIYEFELNSSFMISIP